MNADKLFALARATEGNPGAMTVIKLLLQDGRDVALEKIEPMQLTGSKLWVAYKDVCGSDVAKLALKIEQEDEQFLNAINGFVTCGDCGENATFVVRTKKKKQPARQVFQARRETFVEPTTGETVFRYELKLDDHVMAMDQRLHPHVVEGFGKKELADYVHYMHENALRQLGHEFMKHVFGGA
jgi:hypothetical protein